MPNSFDDDAPPSRPAYFWWALANALALCFAIFSWIACIHIFQHPESPRNYEILLKLKRVPELKAYTALEVPPASAFSPNALYARYFNLSDDDLSQLNSTLLRNYINNFSSPTLLSYIEGEYRVDEVRTLTSKDLFAPGFAVRTQAMVKPDEYSPTAPYPVVVEYLFPTDATDAAKQFRAGDVMAVQKIPNCAAILHVSKVTTHDEPKLCLTVVPIAYGEYRVGNSASFSIRPPERLQPAAKLPMFKY